MLKVHTFTNLIGAFDDICYLGIGYVPCAYWNHGYVFTCQLWHQHGLGSTINVPGSWTFNARHVMFQQVIKTLQKRIWFLLCLPYNYVGLKTYNLECESHKADCRRSIKRIEPFKLLYDKVLQWVGWNTADVITSATMNNVKHRSSSNQIW